MLSLSSIHTGLHVLILLAKPHTLGFGFHTWLVMLSHAVLSVVQIFHLYDVKFGLCLSMRDIVSHPLRCDLTM
jgi:hypothetical protein